MPRPIPVNPKPLIADDLSEPRYLSYKILLVAGLLLIVLACVAVLLIALFRSPEAPTKAPAATHAVTPKPNTATYGQIIDQDTREPITDASIVIRSTDNMIIRWGTNDQGYFSGTLFVNSQAHYSVEVSAPGCEGEFLNAVEFLNRTPSTVSLHCADRH
jgi:hypothetical protein